MKVDQEIRHVNGKDFVVINSTDTVINDTQQFLDLIFNVSSDRIIVRKEIFNEAFFDLKTGLAGDILQKASTYSIRLGIVGNFSGYTSKSLQAFIFESNKSKKIVFIETVEQAFAKLT